MLRLHRDAVQQPGAVDVVLLEASAAPDDDNDDDDSVEGLDDFEDILVCSMAFSGQHTSN